MFSNANGVLAKQKLSLWSSISNTYTHINSPSPPHAGKDTKDLQHLILAVELQEKAVCGGKDIKLGTVLWRTTSKLALEGWIEFRQAKAGVRSNESHNKFLVVVTK